MTEDCCSKTALRLPVLVPRRAAVFVVLALTLAGAGCASKSQDAAAPSGGTSSGKSAGVTPLGTPPEATKSILASQEMGQAMQRNATANGEAMSKAKRP